MGKLKLKPLDKQVIAAKFRSRWCRCKECTPSVGDKMAAKYVDRQHYDEPPRHPEGTLDRPGELVGVAGQVRGAGGHEPED